MRKQANIEIRQMIFAKRLRNYEIAQRLGINQYTFSKWLSVEMTPARKKEVIKAIKEIRP